MDTFYATKNFYITKREDIASYRFITTSENNHGFEMRVEALDGAGQWFWDYELTFAGVAPTPREIVDMYQEQRQRNNAGGQGYMGTLTSEVRF